MEIYRTDWCKTKVSTYQMIPNEEKLQSIKEQELCKIKQDERILKRILFYNKSVLEDYASKYNDKIVSKPSWIRRDAYGVLYEKMPEDTSSIIDAYINGEYDINMFEEQKKNNSKNQIYLMKNQDNPLYIQVTKTLYILELIEKERILYKGKNILGSKTEVLQNKQLLLESLRELCKVLSAYTVEKTGEMSFNQARRLSSPFHYELACDDAMYMTNLTDIILEYKNVQQ